MRAIQSALAIIGAGPGGLCAAKQAAELGIDTVVLDMHPTPGGHYFSLAPEALQNKTLGREEAEGKKLIDDALSAGAKILSGVEVWGIYHEEDFRISLTPGEAGDDRIHEVRAKKIILAPGAIERSLPFPGWTLPGVITTGGALRLVKSQKMLPGHRILLSGCGPMQLALAAKLAESKAKVVAILEQKTWGGLIKGFDGVHMAVGQPQRTWEGMNYLYKVRKAHIPYRVGWSVIEARGDKSLQEAVIAKIDPEGVPIPGSEQRIEVDCICLGYGLVPDTLLTRMLGCEHTLHPSLQVWVPIRDEWMQTSLPGVFAIGDAADIAGKNAAILEGKIAAIGAACQLNRVTPNNARSDVRSLWKRLAGQKNFAMRLNRLFHPPENPGVLARPDTLICRCECVTYGQILEAIKDGATSVQAVKYHTRSGMGWCRGTTCAPLISQIIAQHKGINLTEASQSTIRPPIFPVMIADALEHEGIK